MGGFLVGGVVMVVVGGLPDGELSCLRGGTKKQSRHCAILQ